jgi:hypothetical protein
MAAGVVVDVDVDVDVAVGSATGGLDALSAPCSSGTVEQLPNKKIAIAPINFRDMRGPGKLVCIILVISVFTISCHLRLRLSPPR